MSDSEKFLFETKSRDFFSAASKLHIQKRYIQKIPSKFERKKIGLAFVPLNKMLLIETDAFYTIYRYLNVSYICYSIE